MGVGVVKNIGKMMTPFMDALLLDNPDFTLDFTPKALVLVAFKCLYIAITMG